MSHKQSPKMTCFKETRKAICFLWEKAPCLFIDICSHSLPCTNKGLRRRFSCRDVLCARCCFIFGFTNNKFDGINQPWNNHYSRVLLDLHKWSLLAQRIQQTHATRKHDTCECLFSSWAYWSHTWFQKWDWPNGNIGLILERGSVQHLVKQWKSTHSFKHPLVGLDVGSRSLHLPNEINQDTRITQQSLH